MKKNYDIKYDIGDKVEILLPNYVVKFGKIDGFRIIETIESVKIHYLVVFDYNIVIEDGISKNFEWFSENNFKLIENE
jgi:hypothetical protein